MSARLKKLDERVQQWFFRVARKRPIPAVFGEAGLKKSFPQEYQEPGKFPYTVLLLEESPNTEAVSVPPVDELNTYPSFPTVEKVEEQPFLTVGPSHKAIAGSGQFERGQCDIAIAHPHVTPSSVVVVLLTGNPGPVVVQYVSLDPGRGFTVHLSAPVERTTPFNYALL
jgi:hypothetical protein